MNRELLKKLKEAGFPFDWESRCGHCGYDNGSDSPTLSELIDACGDRFWRIRRKGETTWLVWGYGVDGEDYKGKTPEEAVAKLWLALHT